MTPGRVLFQAAGDRRDGHASPTNSNGLPCPMCKFLLTEVLSLLENENTENELLAQAHEVRLVYHLNIFKGQASEVPTDSPHEGHSLWDLA